MMNTNKLVLENMLEVLEYERKRISLNLHDSVQNKLCLLRDEIGDPALRQKIVEILDELRTIVYNLVPKNLQEFPLAEYLQIYAATLNKTYLGRFRVDYGTNVKIDVPKDIETELFNIVQECFTNIIKYAETPFVLLRYNQLPETLEVIVEDMGKGFDLQSVLHNNSIGLKSIQARADFVGGKCDIKTAPDGNGTSIIITLPIHESWKAKEKTIFDADLEERIGQGEGQLTEIDPRKLRKTILLVDNQHEIIDGLMLMLSLNFLKCKFKACANIVDAQEYLKKNHVDVVITDITMPNGSGLELMEYVKENHPNAKRIIYSINDSPAYVYRAKVKLAVDGYVWKEDSSANQTKHELINAIRMIFESENKPRPQLFYGSKTINETIKFLEIKEYADGIDGTKKDAERRESFKKFALATKKIKKDEWEIISKVLSQLDKNKIALQNIREDKNSSKEQKQTAKETELNRLYSLFKDGKIVTDKTTLHDYYIQLATEPSDKNKKAFENLTRYLSGAKQAIGIDKDWQLIQDMYRIATDFGFFKDRDD